MLGADAGASHVAFLLLCNVIQRHKQGILLLFHIKERLRKEKKEEKKTHNKAHQKVTIVSQLCRREKMEIKREMQK